LLQQEAELVIGKRTQITVALKLRTANLPEDSEFYEDLAQYGTEAMPALNKLKPLMVGKFGMIFTNKSVFDLKGLILENRRKAVAKPGDISQCEVIVPPGPTGMDPSQISFFHALQITTKINKGMIEIQKEVQVLTPGQKVGASEADLLQKMNIMPFSYGMEIRDVYDDGSVLDKSIIDFDPSTLLEKFQAGVANLNAVSLETGYIVKSAVPHMIMNAFKNVAALALETGYKLDALEAAQAAGAQQQAATGAVQKEEEKVEEPEEEEEDMDMGGLFD